MKTYLANAFSLNMIAECFADVRIATLDIDTVKKILTGHFISAIGHQDTANILSKLLEKEIPMNRISIQLETDDCVIVAQYSGSRLPEGATELPEGASFTFKRVRFLNHKFDEITTRLI